MAVSGSKNYSITRAKIIEAALRKIGVYDQGEAIPGSENAAADLSLNLMIKEWAGRGIDIWLRQKITLFVEGGGKQVYSIGPTGDHVTAEDPVNSTLSADAAASATSVSITSTTDMANSDYIGIKLDTGDVFFTTITNVSGTNIGAALPSKASAGNMVYTYTNKADRPHHLLYAFRRDSTHVDIPVELIGENEYQSLTRKHMDGSPTQIWYKPSLVNGELHVWPTGGTPATYDRIVMIGQYYPDDFDTAANSPDFPIEWGNTIIWCLAAELAAEYGVPDRDQKRLWSVAEMKLNTMLDHDVENASVEFTMDYRQ
jgi:hypothetical protein